MSDPIKYDRMEWNRMDRIFQEAEAELTATRKDRGENNMSTNTLHSRIKALKNLKDEAIKQADYFLAAEIRNQIDVAKQRVEGEKMWTAASEDVPGFTSSEREINNNVCQCDRSPVMALGDCTPDICGYCHLCATRDAFLSYDRNCLNPVEAAKSDLLGQMAGIIRELLARREPQGYSPVICDARTILAQTKNQEAFVIQAKLRGDIDTLTLDVYKDKVQNVIANFISSEEDTSRQRELLEQLDLAKAKPRGALGLPIAPASYWDHKPQASVSRPRPSTLDFVSLSAMRTCIKKALKELSGDLNHNNVAQAKEILKSLVD